MNVHTYRVTFLVNNGNGTTWKRLTIWVEGRNERLAIMDASVLVASGVGNEVCQEIREYWNAELIMDIECVIETN